ncbi:Lrp/AsnC family transcriptional regulator [Albidovulum sp.]|uniref:Lrp/AsnC family transcriptional regulator n=1 Tax=Albidovulum sp. TaxID=1872424 RepID=UPI001DD760F6|nr:AsnC family transcriptional regulator [Paracoccaceae bacterium]HPE24775.1 AsnC family transcriptional regulator [Albidovulum sp.]MCB2119142.1 AsnC family transcriptional regulator [Paracoccaceae bacterium]MCB2142939.1 AsnC family transcriptional regulator [Paracoccaceae bacterium]MCB2157529.1 AsnC family transcriptional regulator [Paracoccaceae bacterium]
MRRAPLPPDAIDATDRQILNLLQDGFPLTPFPFRDTAARLGIDEAALIARIRNLREEGIITRFGPFFDAEAMGGAFCLCAMAVPGVRFEEVVTLVNAHPEVAHNYERAHRLNMWFVLATDTPEGIETTARAIEGETGLRVLRFPKQREFFIGFRVQA